MEISFPQSKQFQFTVKEEKRHQQIFTFEKLDSENFALKNDLNRLINKLKSWQLWLIVKAPVQLSHFCFSHKIPITDQVTEHSLRRLERDQCTLRGNL